MTNELAHRRVGKIARITVKKLCINTPKKSKLFGPKDFEHGCFEQIGDFEPFLTFCPKDPDVAKLLPCPFPGCPYAANANSMSGHMNRKHRWVDPINRLANGTNVCPRCGVSRHVPPGKTPQSQISEHMQKNFPWGRCLKSMPKGPIPSARWGEREKIKGSIIAPVIIDARSFLELATERALHMRTEYERAKG